MLGKLSGGPWRRLILLLAVSLVLGVLKAAEPAWDEIEKTARGQTVYWNTWGGDEKANAYIAWVGERVKERYGIALQHVKVGDIAETVSRILAEKYAGRNEKGTVDLLWINGENFHTMKSNGLLFGPFSERLPHYPLVDTVTIPSTTLDFTEPVEGMEVPWGKSHVVFIHDAAKLQNPPKSVSELMDYIKAHPGRFTYPEPPDTLGSTFLKQILIKLTDQQEALQKPVAETTFGPVTAPLWGWLDEVRPHLWRQGQTFPQSAPALRQLLADGEIDIAFSLNPNDASAEIEKGNLRNTVRTYVLAGGTIANTHFVAIPYNSSAKEGAQVVANFLLSPEAQSRKLDPAIWGDPTVLGLEKLSPADRARFIELKRGVATLSPGELGAPLPEPHPSWVERLEAAWRARYSR
ncbi:MAG: ABC transporter substrate-binding protein [Candidatus Competibacteraceae bacterium]|nr:ABC transporter substrate-binding protein [Candidatus Competibacteraceae bacterium]